MDIVNGFVCDCVTGFTGSLCEIPPAPVARILGPSQAGPCDFMLDARDSEHYHTSSSVFNFSMAGNTFTLLLVPENTAPPAAVTNQVLAYASFNGRVLRVDSSRLTAGFDYDFCLTINDASTNVTSPVVTHRVSRSAGDMPTMVIPAPTTTFRSDALVLRPHLQTVNCNGETASSAAEFSFVWLVSPAIAIEQSRLNRRDLFIPENTLAASVSYSFRLTATYGVTSFSATTMPVAVQPTPLHVAISGGTRRAVPVNTEIRLDASASFSPDDPAASLPFAWTCVVVFPSYGGSCGLSAPTLLLPVLVIPANTLVVENTYSFRVDYGSGSAQVSSQEVSVLVEKAPARPNPAVVIDSPSFQVIRPNTKLRLLAAVSTATETPPSELRNLWTETEQSLALTPSIRLCIDG